MLKSPENCEVSDSHLNACYKIISSFLEGRRKYYIDMLNYLNRGVHLEGKEDREYYESMFVIVDGSIANLTDRRFELAFEFLSLEVERSFIKIKEFSVLETAEARYLVQKEIWKMQVYKQVLMAFKDLSPKPEVDITIERIQQMEQEMREKYEI